MAAYDASGAKLPVLAAGIGAAAVDQEQERRWQQQHEAQVRQHAIELARAHVARYRRLDAQKLRAKQLAVLYRPNHMDPVVMGEHEDLEEAGVIHYFPAPIGVTPRRRPPAPPRQWAAHGIPQAAEFPSCEVLNQIQPTDIRQATLNLSEHATYEQLRDQAQHTWTS